jgi:hypothetical protein
VKLERLYNHVDETSELEVVLATDETPYYINIGIDGPPAVNLSRKEAIELYKALGRALSVEWG